MKIGIKNFIIISTLVCAPAGVHARPVIMISPAGDAVHAGRTLADGFERGAARQMIEHVQEFCPKNLTARVVISHEAGEIITHEQKINLANTLETSLYVSLGVYNAPRLSINLYYYKTAHSPNFPYTGLSLCPVKQAHAGQKIKTRLTLDNRFCQQFIISPLTGLPLKILEGIKAPSYYIELGLTPNSDISTFDEVLGEIIQELAREL